MLCYSCYSVFLFLIKKKKDIIPHNYETSLVVTLVLESTEFNGCIRIIKNSDKQFIPLEELFNNERPNINIVQYSRIIRKPVCVEWPSQGEDHKQMQFKM